MKVINILLVFGLMVLAVSCATSVEISKDVNYDYNVNVDLTDLKTYDLRSIPTTIGIEHLMLERIKTAIDTELMFKKLKARLCIASGIDTPQAFEILYHFAFDAHNFIITIIVKLPEKPPSESYRIKLGKYIDAYLSTGVKAKCTLGEQDCEKVAEFFNHVKNHKAIVLKKISSYCNHFRLKSHW